MPVLETATRNAACDAIVDRIDDGSGAGVLVFRTSGGTEVATLTFSDPAFGDAVSGVATAGAITSDTSATGGTTDRATFETSAAGLVLTCSVGTSGEDINLSSVAIGAGDTVAMSSLTVTVAAGSL